MSCSTVGYNQQTVLKRSDFLAISEATGIDGPDVRIYTFRADTRGIF